MMTPITPPHEVTDESKLESMVAAINAGKALPPVVVSGSDAITGSHRLAAWEACGVSPETIEVTDLDYRRACYVADCETHHDDLEAFCAALIAVTADPEIIAAMSDQVDARVNRANVADAMDMTVADLIEYRGW